MNRPMRLTGWDFVDTKNVSDGYDRREIPEATTDNFITLINAYNDLVEVVCEIGEKIGVFDE